MIRSILLKGIVKFTEYKGIFPLEQKEHKKGSYSCNNQLLINKIIKENCRSKEKNLSTARIDYKKAFDSVSHECIKKALKISSVMITFLK